MISSLTTMLTTVLLLLSGTAAAAASAVHPLAHELDVSYSFDQYLLHFDKSYDQEEYIRRSQIFIRNLNMILNHNHGRLTEDGEIIGGGYVMGVNAFTDIDVEELPMGYNKHVLDGGSATSHLRVGDAVLEIERDLRACATERDGHRLAEAGGAAGHERDAAFQ